MTITRTNTPCLHTHLPAAVFSFPSTYPYPARKSTECSTSKRRRSKSISDQRKASSSPRRFPVTTCAGYVGDAFSNVTLRCDEPHERDAVLFHGRPHHHLQLFAEVASSQAHVATPSAMLKRGHHLLGFL